MMQEFWDNTRNMKGNTKKDDVQRRVMRYINESYVYMI